MVAQDSPGEVHRVEQAVAVLKAVADPTRFQLLWALVQREHSVGQLAEMVEAHVAAVSQHLARLRTAGLVESRREGTRIFYRAAGEHVRTLLEGAVLVAQGETASPVAVPVPEEAVPAKARSLAKAPATSRLRARTSAP
ncbi:transcriptional regulator [Streptomyces griseocarneus]|nr:transcriptional regulator [Streptomyces griseocarneus]